MNMKKALFSILAAAALMTACVDLDLTPKSQGSSENWYSNSQELELSLNALYRPVMWYTEAWRLWPTDRWTDDWSQRTQTYDWLGGTISTTWGEGANHWANYYKGIARANTVIQGIEKAKDNLTEAEIIQYTGEAKFFRASFYTYLITLYGDVPFYTEYMTLEEAYEMGRTDRNVVLEQIYKDFDDAAAALPISYTGAQRVTKGTALAMKARAALFMSDWKTCAAAAKACMDLGFHHPNRRTEARTRGNPVQGRWRTARYRGDRDKPEGRRDRSGHRGSVHDRSIFCFRFCIRPCALHLRSPRGASHPRI